MTSKKLSILFVAVFAVSFIAPQSAIEARYDRGEWQNRHHDRIEQLHERSEEAEERVRRAHERVEKRLDGIHERLCKRLGRLHDRFGFRLPKFCNDKPEPETPTLHLTATPMSILLGEDALLEWDADNAETCEADWTDTTGTNGSEEVSPAETIEYEMTCTGEGGETTESVTVTVEDEPEPMLPSVDLSADSDEVEEGATTTLSWTTNDADVCIAEGGDDFMGDVAFSGEVVVAPTATTTYVLACGNENGTTTDSVEVGSVPAGDEPEEGSIVLSELQSNPAVNGEWVEMYNSSNSSVDLVDWKLVDRSATDTIATTSTLLTSGGYAVVVTDVTTAEALSLPDGTLVLVLDGSTIGNNLGNSGDALWLKNSTDEIVDAVSYGSNTDVYNPAPAAPGSGESLARVPVTSDNWEVLAVPTPGA